MRATAFSALFLVAFATGAEAQVNASTTSVGSSPLEVWLRLNGVSAALVAGAVALFGHLIAVWTNLLARTYSPKIETAIQCEFFPAQGASLPLELRFMVANKGGAKSCVSQLTFWVKGIGKDQELARYRTGPRAGRLKFHATIFRGKFLAPSDKRLFVDSGTTQAFMRPGMIQASLSLILVRMTIVLKGGRTYREERMFAVPSSLAGSQTP